jgi:1,4-dihydroxy-6-naphthoate synthase
MKRKITLGLSPCPNDTYIFYHLLKEGFSVEKTAASAEAHHITVQPYFADVEELNRKALNGAELPVTKVSCFAAVLATQHYEILPSGGALGHNCGPLLVSRQKFSSEEELLDRLRHSRILIPGKTTTAHLLLRLFLKEHGIAHPLVEEALYSDILPSLKRGERDFGLIIHEERFTYPSYGVDAPVDLGQWWESQTGLPIPLGCILVRKDHLDLSHAIDQAIRASIDYAGMHPEEAWPFIRSHAQALEEDAIRSHIDLYVTEYSRDPGEKGRAAFALLRKKAADLILD